MELKVLGHKKFLNMTTRLATFDERSDIRNAIDLIFACSNFCDAKRCNTVYHFQK